jgi:hypothetical protein
MTKFFLANKFEIFLKELFPASDNVSEILIFDKEKDVCEQLLSFFNLNFSFSSFLSS